MTGNKKRDRAADEEKAFRHLEQRLEENFGLPISELSEEDLKTLVRDKTPASEASATGIDATKSQVDK